MLQFQGLHRSSLLAIAVLSLCLIAGTPPVAAQIADRQWELGFGLGSANLDSSGEDFDLDLRADVRGGYLFSDRFELEAQVIQADAIFDAHLLAWMVNAVFNFRTDQRIVPYVLVGAGAYELDESDFLGDLLGGDDEDLREEDTAFQVGFGSRFFVGKKRRMAVRLELSNLWLDTDLFTSDRHASFTTGLSWALGRR